MSENRTVIVVDAHAFAAAMTALIPHLGDPRAEGMIHPPLAGVHMVAGTNSVLVEATDRYTAMRLTVPYAASPPILDGPADVVIPAAAVKSVIALARKGFRLIVTVDERDVTVTGDEGMTTHPLVAGDFPNLARLFDGWKPAMTGFTRFRLDPAKIARFDLSKVDKRPRDWVGVREGCVWEFSDREMGAPLRTQGTFSVGTVGIDYVGLCMPIRLAGKP